MKQFKKYSFGVDESQINEKPIIESLKNSKIFDYVKKMKMALILLLENKEYNCQSKAKSRYSKRII